MNDNELTKNAAVLADYVILLRRKCDNVESKTCEKFGNFTRSQQNVLMYIGSHPNCTMTDIANAHNKPLSTLTSITNKLVKQDYIERIRCDEDRRLVRVVLTEKGKTIYEEGYQSIVDFAKLMLNTLTPEDQEFFLSCYKQASEKI